MGSLRFGSMGTRRLVLLVVLAIAAALFFGRDRTDSSQDLLAARSVALERGGTLLERTPSVATNPFTAIDTGATGGRGGGANGSSTRLPDDDDAARQDPWSPQTNDGRWQDEPVLTTHAEETTDEPLLRWLDERFADVSEETPAAGSPERRADHPPRPTARGSDGAGEPALRQDEIGGDSEIRGRVITTGGDPIDGQIITARLRSEGRQSIRSAVSERSGKFLINGLLAGDYLVRAEGGMYYGGTSLLARAGGRALTLALPRRQFASIEGTVTDAFGTPVPGAEVILPEEPRLIADEEGRFVGRVPVPEGQDLFLRYHAAGYLEESRAFDARDWAEDEPLDASVQLRGAGLLSLMGIVLDEGGQPVEGALVRASSRARNFRLSAHTTASGEFVLDEILAATDIELAVKAERRFEPFVANYVDIDRDGVQLQIVLRDASLGRVLATIHDPSGNPVPRMDFVAIGSGQQGQVASLSSTVSGELLLDGFMAGALTLRSRSSPMIVVRGLVVEPTWESTYLITVDMGGLALRGQVLDDSGLPIRGAQVNMTQQHVDGELRTTTTRAASSDARGGFEFSGLGRGARRIVVVAENYADATIMIDPAEGEGPHTVSLRR